MNEEFKKWKRRKIELIQLLLEVNHKIEDKLLDSVLDNAYNIGVIETLEKEIEGYRNEKIHNT